MTIEIYINTEDLTNNQSLAIVDNHGKRWDVNEALRSYGLPYTSSTSGTQPAEVILERWSIKLENSINDFPKDLGTILPKVYKNSIVLFRSLYTYAKLLPAWNLGKKRSKAITSHNLPKLRYRIVSPDQRQAASEPDTLGLSLCESREPVTEEFSFNNIDSPAGAFSIKVQYRTKCDFRIDNSEALLSSHFIGMDEDLFEPSLGQGAYGDRFQASRRMEVGSVPSRQREIAEQSDNGQAYGSLSTFHHAGPATGTSPLTALRAARELNKQSPTESPPVKQPPNHRSAQGSRSSLKSADGPPAMGRRTSVSFMPFKSPSLSASPSQVDVPLTASPRGSIGKSSPLSTLAEARNPASLSPYSTVATRSSPLQPDHAVSSSTSSSPKPAPITRYSSSFGHRRGRLSTGGGSRTEDDNNSSGKASIASSSAQPGSGVLAETGGGSSGSIDTDDDKIGEFLKMLDQKKDLKSFQVSSDASSAEASTRRTSAALSKFQRMRDSNAALSDSMSSSLLLHRSSSSSSRQLSSVPPMVAGTSMSISSSPGKPISPHTPHTPAIPSRLSANSIVDYTHRDRSGGRNRLHEEDSRASRNMELADDGSDPHARNAGAIDIPTSPRPYHPSYRRSSSVAQQVRTMPLDDDLAGDYLPFGMRSASLGADERPPMSLSALVGLQEGSDLAAPNRGPSFGQHSQRPRHESEDSEMSRQPSSSFDGPEESGQPSSRGVPYRPRLAGGTGRGQTPPQGSSLNNSTVENRGSGSGSGSSDQQRGVGGGRYSFTRPTSNFEEEEPLLFAMSDFGAVQQSRRSLEEGSSGGRRGSNTAGSDRGGADSGSSSRRGSRRGGHTWV